MHIALVIYGHLDTLTGGYIYDRQLVEHLRAKGHRITVVSLPMRRYLLRLADNFRPALARQLVAGGFDLIVEDELCHPSLFLINRRLQRTFVKPIVAVVHQVLCDEPRSRWLNHFYALVEKRYLASVNGLVFNSISTRRTVVALTGMHRPAVVATPAGDRLGNPPARDMLKVRALRPGPLQLLFLGNVIPRKGLLPLLSALAAAGSDDWRLDVVGSRTMAPAHVRRVERFVRTCGLSARVRLKGARPAKDLTRILARCQVLFMPYAYEGFGIVFLEAMGFGLPVVASSVGAARENVQHGINGFLVDPADRQAPGRIVAWLHADRRKLWAMSQAALKCFDTHLGWHTSMARTERFFVEMAARSPEQPSWRRP